MISDIRQLADRSQIACDLCIIGGGAAGISLALEHANSRLNIVVLESGGMDFEGGTQDLCRGKNVGLPYFELDATRLRYFGGTTNHWGGLCRPLDPIDFEPRDWVPSSGWPIAYSDFAAYLGRAAKLCELPSVSLDADELLRSAGKNDVVPALASIKPEFAPGVFNLSPPTRFGKVYAGPLDKAGNVKVFLNANVTSINTQASPASVDSLTVATLDGKSYTVRPKVVVLATGGIENARLLLASRKTYANGLGNKNGLVGRYFTDHIELASGYILAPTRAALFDNFYHRIGKMSLAMDVTPEAQRKYKLLNMDITLNGVASFAETSEGFGALRRIVKALSSGHWPVNFYNDVGTVITHVDEVVSSGLNRGGGDATGLYLMYNRCEVAPNPQSRVSLDDQVDPLGMPRVKLDWRLTSQDYLSIRKAHELLGQALGRSGLGRVKIELEPSFKAWPAVLQGGNHHMGTTRMSGDERSGVVDSNCRIFGMENLYVVGSSVFTTTGRANPTLNLLAMTLRLSDHLKQTRG